jgi:hypothetical protein
VQELEWHKSLRSAEGLADCHIKVKDGRKARLTIHLKGAGSAINLTRELVRLGYRISGGIAHEYDADQEL